MDTNKMNLSERKWGGVGGINRDQDKDQWRSLANTIMDLRVPYNVRNFYCAAGSFSRRTQLHGVRWLLFYRLIYSLKAILLTTPLTYSFISRFFKNLQLNF
jgi:hypothetical protein